VCAVVRCSSWSLALLCLVHVDFENIFCEQKYCKNVKAFVVSPCVRAGPHYIHNFSNEQKSKNSKFEIPHSLRTLLSQQQEDEKLLSTILGSVVLMFDIRQSFGHSAVGQ